MGIFFDTRRSQNFMHGRKMAFIPGMAYRYLARRLKWAIKFKVTEIRVAKATGPVIDIYFLRIYGDGK
jgi:hypothetical protein